MPARSSTPSRLQERAILLQIIAWCAGIVTAIAVLSAAKLAGEIMAPTVLACLLALTLTPLVAALERWGLPAPLSAGLVVGFGVLAAAGAIYLLMPSFDEWRLRAPSVLRSLEWQLRDIEREIEQSVGETTIKSSDDEDGEKSPTEAVMDSGQKLATDALLGTPRVLLAFLYVAFLCFFLLAERATLRHFVLWLCRDWKTRLRLSRAILDMRRSVSRYLLTVAFINALLGATAGVAFWALDLPNPMLWGAMVALLNFMPYIGPVLANIVVFVVGLTTYPYAVQALYPVLALSALNMVEGQLVTPMVVGRRSQVGPLSVFLAVAFGAWLWGALGALVASPLLIVGHRFWRRMIVPRVQMLPMGSGLHPHGQNEIGGR